VARAEDSVKALTIYQPWCSLIMIGAKPFEFRKWDYRSRVPEVENKRIVLHAAKRPVRREEVLDLVYRLQHKAGEGTGLIVEKALPLLERVLTTPGCLPLSSGLGTAKIGTPRRVGDIFTGKVADSDRLDHHLYGWPLGEIESFEPIVPMRGLQGFWIWPQKVAA
jgi:hypothetical protein